MKKIIIITIAAWMLFSLINPAPGAEAEGTPSPSLTVSVDPPGVQVHGVKIDAPAPFLNDGVIWVPFRAVAEAYNIRVEWGADTLIRQGEWDDNTVLFIDYQGRASTLTIDGVNAVIIDDKTFVPYGFLAGLNFDDNNIISKLGYSIEHVQAILDDREIFRKHFTEPNEEWNLRKLTRGLPYPIGFRYRTSDIQAEPIKSISIEYDSYYDYPYPGGNGLNPFRETISENNALILFATIEDLEQVNFLYYFDDELNRTDSFVPSGLSERFGGINPIDLGFEELYDALTANFQIPEWYFAHYSRIYLGASSEDVLYRNGEPDEIIQQPDGSVVWKYTEPSAYYYFDSPVAEHNDNLTGLYATRFSVADEESESYLKLTAYLGFPSIIKDIGDGKIYIAYPLRDGQQKHAYFILQDDKVTATGVMYSNDYPEHDWSEF